MEETKIEKDDNFEMICQISSKIFEVAKKKMLGEKTKTEIEIKDVKEELMSLLNEVNFINEIEAKRTISEALLDLEYINNPEVKALSLRLGQIYRSQEKNNEM